jgi:PAS domain S-box-containing protein
MAKSSRDINLLACHGRFNGTPSFISEGVMALVESSTDFIALTTLDQRLTFLNQAGLDLLGLPDLEAVQQTTIADYFGEETVDRIYSEVVPSVMTTGSWQGLLHLRHFQTGQRIPVFFNSTLVRDPQTGEPIGMGTLGREVSAIQQAERERQAAEVALNRLMIGTAAVTGQDFFTILVEQVAKALGVAHVLVSQRVGDRLQTLAFWSHDGLQPNFSYDLRHTPCELSLQHNVYTCSGNLRASFPKAPKLSRLKVKSYLGIAMKNRMGEAIGNLCLVDTKFLDNIERMETMLRIFAARAAAELERQETTQALERLNQELEQRIQQRTAELEASEQKFRAIFNNTFQFTGLMTPTGTLLEVNQTALDFAGLGPDDVLRRPFWETHWWSLSAQTQQQLQGAIAQAAQGQFVRYEVDLRGAHDSIITVDFSIRPLQDETGSVVLLIPEAHDITNLKTAERALKDSQALLQLVMDSLPQAIFWKDRDSRFLGCNRQLLADAGLPSVEMILGKIDDDLPWCEEAPQYRADDQAVMESGQAKLNIEEPMTKTGDRHRWLRTNKIPLHNGDGAIIGVLGTYEDITDRKQMEAALWASNDQLALANQKLSHATRLKDEFLANMSHELRTPLSSILGMTQALRREVYGSLSDRQHRSIGIIERSGRHLLTLINDVLDLAKIEAGKMDLRLAPVALPELCQLCLTLVQPQALQKHISISMDLDPSLTVIEADELRLKQAIINLLDNAIKFTPPEGQVSLVVGQESDSCGDQVLVITVTDTGIGIAPADHDRLFESFVQLDSSLTREHGGTGLGLALVKRIAEIHGGQVTVASDLGQGSQFTLRLPCPTVTLPPPPPTMPASLGSAVPSLSLKRSILVAEDNSANRNLLVDLLRSLDYTVTTAEDGHGAILAALAHPPNLILMDVQMPGMDGLEAMRHLRTHDHLSQLPIIALTALVMPGDRERCLQAGATDYLSKPLQVEELTAMLRRLL